MEQQSLTTGPPVSSLEGLTDRELEIFLATLGQRIKQLRKEKGLLMRDVMVRTGYYDAQWRKYESGGSLRLPSMLKVAIALRVSLTELLGGLGQWPLLSAADIQEKMNPAKVTATQAKTTASKGAKGRSSSPSPERRQRRSSG